MPTDIADAIFARRRRIPLSFEGITDQEEEMSPSQKAISQVFLPEGLSSSGRNMMAGGYREKIPSGLPSEEDFNDLGTGSPGLRAGGSFAGGQTEGFGALPRGMDEVSSGGGAWRPPTKKTTVPQYADLGMAIAATTKRSRLGKTQEELPESELAQGLGMKVDPMLPLGSPERSRQALAHQPNQSIQEILRSGGAEAALAWDSLKAAGIDPRFAAFGDMAKTPQERAMDSMLELEKERLDLERYRIEMAKEQAREAGDAARMYQLTALETQNRRAKQALDAQERMATSANQNRESVARITAETEDKRHQRDLDSRKKTPEEIDYLKSQAEYHRAMAERARRDPEDKNEHKDTSAKASMISQTQKVIDKLAEAGVFSPDTFYDVLEKANKILGTMGMSISEKDFVLPGNFRGWTGKLPQMPEEKFDYTPDPVRKKREPPPTWKSHAGIPTANQRAGGLLWW